MIADRFHNAASQTRVVARQFLQPDTIHRGQPQWKPPSRTTGNPDGGRTLYNSITLPKAPRIDPLTRTRSALSGGGEHPVVIPIDLGRQLFVDDFLVESITNVTRVPQAGSIRGQ